MKSEIIIILTLIILMMMIIAVDVKGILKYVTMVCESQPVERVSW